MVFVFSGIQQKSRTDGSARLFCKKVYMEMKGGLRRAAYAALLKGSGKKGSMYYNLFDEFLF